MNPLLPLGDRAWLATFSDEAEASGWADAVRLARIPGVTDVVLAYRSVGVHADPDQIDLDALAGSLRNLLPSESDATPGRTHEIPVYYDGEDLNEVADRLGLASEQVVAEHAGVTYRVFAIGFLPGFPYAGYLPESLTRLPRRSSPRTRVAPGSVAIVGRQTAIYPGPSPGGWHLIGRTPLQIVDVATAFFPIQAGDLLRFRPINECEFASLQGRRLDS